MLKTPAIQETHSPPMNRISKKQIPYRKKKTEIYHRAKKCNNLQSDDLGKSACSEEKSLTKTT
jgi:hypothetical protein